MSNYLFFKNKSLDSVNFHIIAAKHKHLDKTHENLQKISVRDKLQKKSAASFRDKKKVKVKEPN